MTDDAPQPTRLALIRHGESQSSVARVIAGPRSRIGLSDLGRFTQAGGQTLALPPAELAGAVLYASDYRRAIETAELIAPALGNPPVLVEPGFGEQDPGPDCDGLTFEQFVERYGMPDWESDPHAVTFPGGETMAEVHHRVGAALQAVMAQHFGETVVVCCHGGVVNAVIRLALRAPITGGFELYTANASLTELALVRPGRWRLLRYNDTAHLAGLPAETPRG